MDMKSVTQNLHIIQDLLEKPSEDLNLFLEKTTSLIYHILDRFISDLQYLVSFVPCDDQSVASRINKDLQYLVEMKEMDEEILRKRRDGVCETSRIVMSSVVPIAGLIMARFHMYECELKTSIEIWGQKGEKVKDVTPSLLADEGKCFLTI